MKTQNFAGAQISMDENPSEGLPVNEIPLVYMEQMVGIAIGAFVSKIVLGIENPPNSHTPKMTIVMPTKALHLMAKQLNDVLSDKDNQKQIDTEFKNNQDGF